MIISKYLGTLKFRGKTQFFFWLQNFFKWNKNCKNNHKTKKLPEIFEKNTKIEKKSIEILWKLQMEFLKKIRFIKISQREFNKIISLVI